MSHASTAFWAVDDSGGAEMPSVKFEEYEMPGFKTVDGIATSGGAKTAWFKDTEENMPAGFSADPEWRRASWSGHC